MRLGWYAYHLNDITTTEWLKTTARADKVSFSFFEALTLRQEEAIFFSGSTAAVVGTTSKCSANNATG